VKRCTNCGAEKPLDAFHRRADSGDGHRANCKTCRVSESHANYECNGERIRLRSGEWFKGNRERALAARHAYYLANREKAAAQGKVWRDANPERYRARNNAYQRTHPQYRRNHEARIRAAKGVAISPLRPSDWREIQDSYCGLCVYCGTQTETTTADHVVPLKGGGAHTTENVVPACFPCNQSKGARSLLFWLARRRLD